MKLLYKIILILITFQSLFLLTGCLIFNNKESKKEVLTFNDGLVHIRNNDIEGAITIFEDIPVKYPEGSLSENSKIVVDIINEMQVKDKEQIKEQIKERERYKNEIEKKENENIQLKKEIELNFKDKAELQELLTKLKEENLQSKKEINNLEEKIKDLKNIDKELKYPKKKLKQ